MRAPRSRRSPRRCRARRRTSSPRTTSGQPSRSERGIFASTNTSWIFFERPASRSPARHPRTLRPGSVERMRQPPNATSPVELDGARLEPEPVVLAHRLDAAAEVDPLRAAGASSSSASAGGIVRRSSSARRMFSRAPGWICSSSGRISARSSPRIVSAFDESSAEGEPALAAERLGLLTPERQQRPNDAVLAPRLDPRGRCRS